MDRDDILLKEYEICHDSAQRIESNIWKTSGTIGIGSIGTLLLLFYQDLKLSEQLKWPVVAILVLIFIVVVWLWWGMANRWWDIQHVTFLRMSHIERDIDIYYTMYIRYKDTILEKDPLNFLSKKLQKWQLRELNVGLTQEHIEKLKKYLTNTHFIQREE